MNHATATAAAYVDERFTEDLAAIVDLLDEARIATAEANALVEAHMLRRAAGAARALADAADEHADRAARGTR